jgi:hypothetical protein
MQMLTPPFPPNLSEEELQEFLSKPENQPALKVISHLLISLFLNLLILLSHHLLGPMPLILIFIVTTFRHYFFFSSWYSALPFISLTFLPLSFLLLSHHS